MQAGSIRMRGSVRSQHLPQAQRVSWLWKLRNLPNVWRGWWRWQVARLLGIPTLYAELHALLRTADGRTIDYGLIATRVVTDAFVQDMVSSMVAQSATWSDYKFHASGTGTNAEATTDTALQTEVETRVAGTQGQGASPNQYQTVGTISYTATYAITEHGVFNASPGGVLLDRSVFTAINVSSGDSIQFTYTLTVNSGG